MTLGQKIKKLRNDKGLTQKDLSEHLHVTFQTVSKWENDENEPDVATLRELTKLFDCSMNYLLSEDDEVKEDENDKKESEVEAKKETTEPEQKVIIIHKTELHTCQKCGKEIEPHQLIIDRVCTRHAGRGKTAQYREDFYHKACLEKVNKERKEAQLNAQIVKGIKTRKLSFGWAIAGGVAALALSLGLLFGLEVCRNAIHPGYIVLISVIFTYMIFAELYCIISGSFAGEIFCEVGSWSIKFPGLLFTLDMDGIIWFIAVKILFAILGVMITVGVLGLAVIITGIYSIFAFPFTLIHNERNDYIDAD